MMYKVHMYIKIVRTCNSFNLTSRSLVVNEETKYYLTTLLQSLFSLEMKHRKRGKNNTQHKPGY